MLGAIKTLLGIGSGVSWIAYAVVFALGIAAGGGGAWWIQSTRIDGYQRQAAASEKGEAAARVELAIVTANRDQLSRDNDRLAEIVASQQREADAADAKAKATLKAQQVSASQIRADLQNARDYTEGLLQQIEDAHHAQPTVVSEIVVDDFHPLIRLGLERLRCEQRAGNRSEAPDGCRVPLQIAAGGAGAAGDPSGAGDYRPGFAAQLRMLNDLWRLHDWGASCYADKRAIAAAQEAAP
jgi:hypothetical protein